MTHLGFQGRPWQAAPDLLHMGEGCSDESVPIDALLYDLEQTERIFGEEPRNFRMPKTTRGKNGLFCFMCFLGPQMRKNACSLSGSHLGLQFHLVFLALHTTRKKMWSYLDSKMWSYLDSTLTHTRNDGETEQSAKSS